MSGHWLFDPHNDLNDLVEFNDPFCQKFLQQINISYAKNPYDNSWRCTARIHYQAGNTGGFQEFSAADPKSLHHQIKQFIDSKR